MNRIKRVMISSTARDLPKHRRKVMDAVLAQGMFPLMMEYLPASDTDALEASLDMVDQADLYIGIFAKRYGHIPNGHVESITELEYQRAAERKIPKLIFIAHEEHSFEQHVIDEGEKAEKLRILKDEAAQAHVVNFFRSSDDLKAQVVVSLVPYRTRNAPNLYEADKQQAFSDVLTTQMDKLNKTIKRLTDEQYHILDMLRYQKRVSIAGCAGSGKTLIAAEKAVRLDRAGLRTLIMCHNRFLAGYIRHMVSGTGVQVIDFMSWVRQLIMAGGEAGGDNDWAVYVEPTDAMLSAAFDALVESHERYDAIIVDEGQDFRELWWMLIEAAYSYPESGILYIFHDDNQALLPNRSKYPIMQAPHMLTKNCRNAGAIFDLVKRFHPQSPEPTLELSQFGQTRLYQFKHDNQMAVLQSAVKDMLMQAELDKMVILTTEPDPATSSILHGLNIELDVEHRWQEGIAHYLPKVQLSDAPYPTENDIATVQSAARRTLLYEYEHLYKDENIVNQAYAVKWNVFQGAWRLRPPRDLMGKPNKSRTAIYLYLSAGSWVEGLPEPEFVTIDGDIHRSGNDLICLETVATFKGLESDDVILFVPRHQADLEAMSYVGASRARLLLYVVAHREAVARVPHLFGAEQ